MFARDRCAAGAPPARLNVSIGDQDYNGPIRFASDRRCFVATSQVDGWGDEARNYTTHDIHQITSLTARSSTPRHLAHFVCPHSCVRARASGHAERGRGGRRRWRCRDGLRRGRRRARRGASAAGPRRLRSDHVQLLPLHAAHRRRFGAFGHCVSDAYAHRDVHPDADSHGDGHPDFVADQHRDEHAQQHAVFDGDKHGHQYAFLDADQFGAAAKAAPKTKTAKKTTKPAAMPFTARRRNPSPCLTKPPAKRDGGTAAKRAETGSAAAGLPRGFASLATGDSLPAGVRD